MTSNDLLMKQQKSLARSVMQEHSYDRKELFQNKGVQVQTSAKVMAKPKNDRSQDTSSTTAAEGWPVKYIITLILGIRMSWFEFLFCSSLVTHFTYTTPFILWILCLFGFQKAILSLLFAQYLVVVFFCGLLVRKMTSLALKTSISGSFKQCSESVSSDLNFTGFLALESFCFLLY